MSEEFWFDGDYSEQYYGTGHWDKVQFARLVDDYERQCDPEGEIPFCNPDRVQHMWARWENEEQFVFVSEGDLGAVPLTRYVP